ncbi:MAG: right-handed parallel beta-helix repeat-containing protein [Bacteroidota bacterium]
MMRYLMSWITGVILVLSFVMCSKDVNKAVTSSAPGTATTPEQNSGTPNDNTASTGPNCTYTVKTSEWFVDGATFAPGSVICIPAGTRSALLLKNFKGTAAKPIVIINKGGQVNIMVATTASYGLKTQNCQFFKILGNGVAGIPYGINISGGNISMTMDDLSSDFEISNIEVRNSGFAGIMAKTDPTCDVATQRGHFTMRNISMHNNYIHQTGGEGVYVGNSFYADGVSLSCGTVLPHDVIGVKIYNNLTDSTGCEGIQVGSAISGCEIYSNTVKSPGLKPFASGQDNGIQIGEGTGGKCYNNLIKDAPGNGLIVLGLGDNLVYNNYILDAKTHGIFADSRYTPGQGFVFINNTIVAPGQNGIKLNSETIPMNTTINNVIIKPGAGVAIAKKSNAVKLTSSNNYSNTDISACQFVNYTGGDFHLLSTSPLINAGANTSEYGVTSDYYGKARPSGVAYDIGATEY